MHFAFIMQILVSICLRFDVVAAIYAYQSTF